jgi:hypothetical protein
MSSNNMKRNLVLAMAAGLALLGPAGFAQQSPGTSIKRLVNAREEESKSEDLKTDRLLRPAIERVGLAFENGDPDALEDCLVPRKIYLSLKARGDEAGYYGRSQVKFMFAKLFRDRKTAAFTYDPDDLDDSGDGGASFRADWSYSAHDQDEVVTERLRFKMERGKNDWQVSEIRAQFK